MLFDMQCTSVLGTITMVGTETALTGLWMEGQTQAMRDMRGPASRVETPILRRTKEWLARYFAGEQPDPREIPLELRGTAFQIRVWELLRQIPYGTVTTYGTLARQLEQAGKRMSARAVGGAVGRNPVSILIPCHRVIGADGSLTGYSGGIDRKQWLLRHEGAVL